MPNPNSYLSVSEPTFVRQISHLKRKHKFLTSEEVLQVQGVLPRGTLVLTFDDGYSDNFDVAAPILSDLEVPAVFFVTTGLIDGVVSPWWYSLWKFCISSMKLEFQSPSGPILYSGCKGANSWATRMFYEVRSTLLNWPFKDFQNFTQQISSLFEVPPNVASFMSWQEIRELSNHPLFAVGGHTATHSNLRHMKQIEIENELDAASSRFRSEGVATSNHFAYPYGLADQPSSAVVGAAGYKIGWIASGRRASGIPFRLGLPRLGVAPHHGPREIAGRIALRQLSFGYSR